MCFPRTMPSVLSTTFQIILMATLQEKDHHAYLFKKPFYIINEETKTQRVKVPPKS